MGTQSQVLKRIDTFLWEATQSFSCLPPFSQGRWGGRFGCGVNSSKKEIFSSRSKFFPLRVYHILEGLSSPGKQQEVTEETFINYLV